jgi:hypothetical protein
MADDDRSVAALAESLAHLTKAFREQISAMTEELDALRRAVLNGEHRLAAIEAASHAEPAVATRGTQLVAAAGDAAPTQDPAGFRTFSAAGYGLYAASSTGTGALCRSFGAGGGVMAFSEQGTGVDALSLGAGDGVRAASARGNGLHAVGGAALGNEICPSPAGVFAEGGSGFGLYAVATSGDAVVARSEGGRAVDAHSVGGTAVRAQSETGVALEVDGCISVRGSAIGEITLAVGASKLTVQAPASGHSMIVLTIMNDPGPGTRVWVSARRTGSFTISTSTPLLVPLHLQSLILN